MKAKLLSVAVALVALATASPALADGSGGAGALQAGAQNASTNQGALGIATSNQNAVNANVPVSIAGGNVSMAGRLLDRPYSLSGEVVKGHGIGSKQTVPTLNLATEAELLPANGVYITRTHELDPASGRPREWESISNIGTRPTFDGDALSIETFLLEPLRGESPLRIRVEFLRRVREERKFESPEALKAQILRDVGRAKAYFRRTSSLQSS